MLNLPPAPPICLLNKLFCKVGDSYRDQYAHHPLNNMQFSFDRCEFFFNFHIKMYTCNQFALRFRHNSNNSFSLFFIKTCRSHFITKS